jgi:ASC-1-like (ASCH) protein
MIIKKKSWPKIFALMKSGKKKFDVRVADFKVREGDTLVLEEYDPKRKACTGRKMTKKVKYVLKFGLNDFGQKKKIAKEGLYIIQV